MIYKREPIQHSLPTGWNDMDAVKYSNINSIQGLQHVDNALAAKQNATYDCKNVYQDESGNLTVRPALQWMNTFSHDEVLGRYNTGLGTVMHVIDNGNHLLDFGGESELTEQTGLGKVAVQESDGKVYAMYTGTDGKLKFKMWDGSAVVDVEPDIPTNSKDKPLSRLYNLLSDKTKYETIPVLPKVVSNDMFSDFIITDLEIGEALEWSILKSGHIILVYSTKIVVAVPYGGGYKIVELPVEIGGDGDILIEDTLSSSSCIVSTLTTDVNNSFQTFTRTQYSVDYRGYITKKTWSFTKQNTLKYKLGYADSVFMATAIPDTTTSGYVIAMDWIVGGLPSKQLVWSDTVAASVDNMVVDIAISKTSVLFTALNTSVDHFGWNAVDLLWWEKWSTDGNSDGKRYYNRGFDLEYLTTTIISGYDNWYLIDGRDGKPAIYLDLTYQMYRDGKLESTVYPSPAIPDGVISGLTTFISTNDGLIVHSGRGNYYITPTIQHGYDFDMDGDTVFNLDSTIVVDKTEGGYSAATRVLLPQYITVSRPVSGNFPVLSEIEDEVLTSFYLDNIYWFVTKHRVFGTGVANEQFSIKYFDPRKYFHFDETLTGAIRISDSSFWVFYNKGAYLIYKSTSSLYDELSGGYIEMITWLCTATAESKGCDFENAVVTLPVTNYVSCVTSDDISVVQMRENVQTDDRILVPMTLDIQRFTASLLNQTASVVTGTFRYNALFFLNREKQDGTTPVMVFNAATGSWWYWELPVNKVQQTVVTETGMQLLASYNGEWRLYDLYTEYFDHELGGLTWHLYGDQLELNAAPVKIDWFWESALLHLNTNDYKKQLLFTNFTFGEYSSRTVSFEYNFEVYDREYSERSWTEVTQVVERAKTYSCKNIIAKFMYLQLYIKSVDDDSFETYTKPKISSITLKYRILPGGLL